MSAVRALTEALIRLPSVTPDDHDCQKLLIALLVSLLLAALLGLLHRLAAKRGNSRDNAGTTFSNDADHHHDRTL